MKLAGREIAVVGAGIGGLACAIALADRHAHVTVFEQAEELAEVGAGIQIAPNGVAVLEALGLRDEAEKLAELPQGIELRDHTSEKTVARIQLGENCVARYGRPYWQFHRADLLSVLEDGARNAGVNIRPGKALVDVARSGKGCSLSFGDGTEAKAEIVIGADGIRSRVRKTRFDDTGPRFTRQVAWRGLIDSTKIPDGLVPDAACVTMGPGRHIVTYPLRGGSVINFVAIEERDEWVDENWGQPDEAANLRSAFSGWSAQVDTLLNAVDETFLWGLFDHKPLNTWVDGNIALLGDACHPMLPFLAQGATAALEDAWVLAAELDIAEEPELGLLAYEARRKPRTSRVQSASVQNGRLYHLGPGLSAAAQLGLSATSKLAPNLLLSKFDWLYGADVVSAEATI